MITLHDLDEAIAECQGVRNPDARTCEKLAAFYIIKDHMYPDGAVNDGAIQSGGGNISIGNNYSNDAQWKQFDDFGYESDTEFAELASRTEKNALMRTMDELMTVLEATNPRLYRGVVRKLLDNQE